MLRYTTSTCYSTPRLQAIVDRATTRFKCVRYTARLSTRATNIPSRPPPHASIIAAGCAAEAHERAVPVRPASLLCIAMKARVSTKHSRTPEQLRKLKYPESCDSHHAITPPASSAAATATRLTETTIPALLSPAPLSPVGVAVELASATPSSFVSKALMVPVGAASIVE